LDQEYWLRTIIPGQRTRTSFMKVGLTATPSHCRPSHPTYSRCAHRNLSRRLLLGVAHHRNPPARTPNQVCGVQSYGDAIYLRCCCIIEDLKERGMRPAYIEGYTLRHEGVHGLDVAIKTLPSTQLLPLPQCDARECWIKHGPVISETTQCFYSSTLFELFQ